jgi:hypothetical protein
MFNIQDKPSMGRKLAMATKQLLMVDEQQMWKVSRWLPTPRLSAALGSP